MSSIIRHVILNHVDTPLKIILWTAPEIVMILAPPFVGLLLSHFTMGLMMSIGCYAAYKQYQRRFGKGQFQAVAYWFLPQTKRFNAFPPSYIREYIG